MTEMSAHQSSLVEVLQGSRLFGDLGVGILSEMAELLELKHVHGGRAVFRKGDLSDSMIIVVSGRLRVSVTGANGKISLYNEIAPGEVAGETGLILHQERTADVTAVRDSTIASLSLKNFEALLTSYPVELNRVFSQAIFNHLRHKPQEVERRLAQRFALIPLHADVDVDATARQLTQALAGLGRAHHVASPADWRAEARTSGIDRWGDRYDEIERQTDFLVFEADDFSAADWPTPWARRIFRQADQVIFVAHDKAPPVEEALRKVLVGEPGAAMMRKHLLVLHDGTASASAVPEPWYGWRDIERIYPVRSGNAADFSRVARFLTGNALGLVLGGGGARGFAHLGVLRALSENGISIDIVGGNSMGALIGAQFACGVPLEDIRRETVRFAKGGERVTVPVISLLSGKRMQRDIQTMFDGRTIESLWQPFFAAACNLSKATTTVQDRGPLWRAVLASNSPAGLLPPVVYQGDLLVDGAILDNVPVSAMRMRLGTVLEKRRGNGTVVAVDVDVAQEFAVSPEQQRLSGWKTVKGYFSSSDESAPGIGPILYRAGHIGGMAQRERTIALADRYLQPPVARFPLMGYDRSEEIVEVGYRYAMSEIERWTAA